MSNYIEMLRNAKPKIVITPASLIMEKVGDTFRGLYLGQNDFTRVDQQTGEVKVNRIANFYDGEKVRFHMGTQLTRAIAPLKVGVSVEIVLIELKKNTKGGSTKIYSIAPLDMPIQNVSELFGGFLEVTAPQESDLLFPDSPAPAQLQEHIENTSPKKTPDKLLSDMGFEPVDGKSKAAQPALMPKKVIDFQPD